MPFLLKHKRDVLPPHEQKNPGMPVFLNIRYLSDFFLKVKSPYAQGVYASAEAEAARVALRLLDSLLPRKS